MSTTESPGRVERLQKLVAGYPGDWTADGDGDTLAGSPVQRFALLMNRATAPGVDDWWITHHTTLDDALESAGEDVLFGNTAVGVFDLDTGDVHGVHVAIPVVSSVGGTDAPAAPWDTVALEPAKPAPEHRRLAALLQAVGTTLRNIGAPGPDEAASPNGRLVDWLAGERREGWDGSEGEVIDGLRADADAAREVLRAVALGWAGGLTDRDHEPIVSLACEPWRLRDHGVRTVASLTLQELATALVAEADALRFTSTRFRQALKTIQHDTSGMCGCGEEAAAALRAGCAHPEMYGELKRDRFRLLEHLEALEAVSRVLIAAAGLFTTEPDGDAATRTLHSAAAAVDARISSRTACV